MNCKCKDYYRYKSTFSSELKILKKKEIDSGSLTANLKNLWPIMPASLDLENNCDLIPAVLNSAVGNMVNKNYDSVSNKTLVAIAPKFLWKLVDIEHDRSKCVGVICNYGFSRFQTDELITAEEAANSTEPVNLALAILIWQKTLSNNYIKFLLDTQDEENIDYKAISASWELDFYDYGIAVGRSGFINDCAIYTGKQKEIFEKFLPQNGGKGTIEKSTDLNGTENDLICYRVVLNEQEGDILPSGIGLVEYPAAFVKGLSLVPYPPEPQVATTEVKPSGTYITKEQLEEYSKSSVNENKSSNIEKSCVLENKNIQNTNKFMLTDIKKLTDETLKECKASEVVGLFDEAVKAANVEYEKELTKKADLLKSVETAKAELDTKLAAAAKELEKSNLSVLEVTTKFNDLQAKFESKVKNDQFQERMASVNEEYDLSDEKVSAIVAKKIKAVNTDEEYVSLAGEFSVLLSGFKKAKTVVASTVAAVVTEAVKTAEVVTAGLPNAQAPQESYADKAKRIFNIKDNIKI